MRSRITASSSRAIGESPCGTTAGRPAGGLLSAIHGPLAARWLIWLIGLGWPIARRRSGLVAVLVAVLVGAGATAPSRLRRHLDIDAREGDAQAVRLMPARRLQH